MHEGELLGGRFLIHAEVGRGGVGVVYHALDRETGQPVALKVIASEPGEATRDEARLAREGELLASLDHPGIVKTVGWGLLDGQRQPFVAMEWLDGEDLAQRQRRAPLGLRQSLELTAQVAEALHAAHRAGVIHRDVKPGNIFLCRQAQPPTGALLECRPKLVDFGVAAKNDIRITRTGDVVGTPAYMAPEQARGDADADARSDLYSLGATLFELISGRPPHVGPTAIATLARLVTTPAPRLSELRRDVPAALERLVAQLLATDPEQRPRGALEVMQQLRELLADPTDLSASPSSRDPITSSRLGSSASRLVTSIVALRFSQGSSRERLLEVLRQRGADAVPLGQDAIVAHLGARHAVGTEATTALELGRRLARAGAQVGIASGRARVGLSSEHGAAQPVGEVVDRAASLARDAEAGMVLADVTTSELGRGRYEFRSRGNGSSIVGEQVRGHRSERAGGAPFVGREPEQAQIIAAFERCRGDRTPVLVTVSGPPGIGKTRLYREVIGKVSALAEAPLVISQRSEAYASGHALGAAADVARAIVELPKGASAREAESAIIERLGPATRDELTAKHRELLARLLANEPLPEGLDPRGSRDALWLALTDLVLQVVAQQPTLIVLEDVQWADPESIGWIDHLLGRASGHPLMGLALARPQFWQSAGARFTGRDHVRLELRPVSRRATRTIASSLLGEGASEAVLDRIAAQAAGLPLFAEELARLIAGGRDTSHAPTIEAAIQVSLDALDEEARDAVGRLSVFGQSVWDTGLEALGIPHAEGVMRLLAAHEVLIEQHGSRFPEAGEWVFKHALVRDVAYAALDETARTALHALAGEWLARRGEDAATVARHLDLGGQPEKAAQHWATAAQRALATNALADAVRMAERSLGFAPDPSTAFLRASYLDEAWSRLDPRAAARDEAIFAMEDHVHDDASAVRARGARARYDDARGAGADLSERLAAVRDEAAALGLHDEEARCSAALAARLAFAGALTAAEAEATRLLALTESHGLRAAAVDAWQTLAIARQTRGQLSAALDARRSAASAARAAGLKEREAMLTTNLGFALTTIGARQEARSALEQGLALADAIGSQGAVRHAQMNLLGWAATFGNDKLLEIHLAATRADADGAASSIWAASDRANLGAIFYRGWELLRSSGEAPLQRAAALLRIAAQGYRATENHDVLPVALGMWGEAERRRGRVLEARALVEEGVAMLQRDAPSLLNESSAYLTLYDVCRALGEEERARHAIAQGMERLLRRVRGLVGTPYALGFLTELPQNAALLAAAEEYGLVPDEVHRLLE